MASFKGILKKISGGLKMAAAYAPGVLALAGVLVAFGGVIGAAVYEDKIEEFKETPVYKMILKVQKHLLKTRKFLLKNIKVK